MCEELKIQQVFASVEHPQTNGQVESANRVLLRGLKRRLDKAKGGWAEEVPRIVWSYHTTPQSSTHETPFSLVYGTDAMLGGKLVVERLGAIFGQEKVGMRALGPVG